MEAAFKSSFCDPTISHNSNQGTCWQCALFFFIFLKALPHLLLCPWLPRKFYLGFTFSLGR